MLGPLQAPEHSGLFESLAHHGFTGSLYHPRADEVSCLAIGLVEHFGAVPFQVSDLLFGQSSGLAASGQGRFGLRDHLLDLVFQERFAPADRAQPGDLTFAENDGFFAKAEPSPYKAWVRSVKCSKAW